MAQSDATCRTHRCDNEPQGGTGPYSRYCSDECGIRFEHIKADAKEAKLAEEREREDRRR